MARHGTPCGMRRTSPDVFRTTSGHGARRWIVESPSVSWLPRARIVPGIRRSEGATRSSSSDRSRSPNDHRAQRRVVEARALAGERAGQRKDRSASMPSTGAMTRWIGVPAVMRRYMTWSPSGEKLGDGLAEESRAVRKHVVKAGGSVENVDAELDRRFRFRDTRCDVRRARRRRPGSRRLRPPAESRSGWDARCRRAGSRRCPAPGPCRACARAGTGSGCRPAGATRSGYRERQLRRAGDAGAVTVRQC